MSVDKRSFHRQPAQARPELPGRASNCCYDKTFLTLWTAPGSPKNPPPWRRHEQTRSRSSGQRCRGGAAKPRVHPLGPRPGRRPARDVGQPSWRDLRPAPSLGGRWKCEDPPTPTPVHLHRAPSCAAETAAISRPAASVPGDAPAGRATCSARSTWSPGVRQQFGISSCPSFAAVNGGVAPKGEFGGRHRLDAWGP